MFIINRDTFIKMGHDFKDQMDPYTLHNELQGSDAKEPIQIPIGSITRTRVKKIKEALQAYVHQYIVTGN